MTRKPTYEELEQKVEELEKETIRRKRAEEALIVGEERYRNIIEDQTEFIVRWLPGGIRTFVNESYCRFFGKIREEVIGSSFFPLVSEEDRKTVEKRIEALTPSNPVSTGEHRVIRPDGTIGWNQWVDRAIFDENGQVVEYQSVGRDITEHKQAEKALQESEHFLKAIIASVGEGIIVYDTELRYKLWNEFMEDLSGLSAEDVLGKDALDLFPHLREEGVDKLLRQALAGESVRSDDTQYRIPETGKIGWVTGVYSPHFDLNGKIIGVVATVHDITERKLAEEALRESEEKYRKIFENIQDAYYEVNIEGTILELSPSIEKISQFKREELIGKSLYDIYTNPEERDEFLKLILDKGKVSDFEIYLTDKDGSQRPCTVSTLLIRDEQGNPIRLIGSMRDVSERKQAENERKRLETLLQQAQKMESIGTLAGGIAHDFNNILSSVLGFSELAKTGLAGGQDIEKYMDEVFNAGLRARELVKHILTFSRQADMEKQPIEISLLIKETLKFLRASLPATIEVRSDLGVSDSTVMADPSQIHQILMNLCTNAAHAMQDKGGVLDVRLEDVRLDNESLLPYKELKQGIYLRLSVGDTGDGIPREIIDRIFDPFFTTKERGEGTGLGLATVHGIVKDMGGTISVYSEPGKGTTFHVLLPKHEGEAADLTSPRYILKKGKGRILFVDDEKSIVGFGRQMLGGLGYEVVTTTSSLEALELFESSPDKFDLVLTDMTMPKMTGLELSKRMIKTRPDIPIVLCTGFSAGLTAETIRDAGIREMIMKPMIANELAAAVEKALKP